MTSRRCVVRQLGGHGLALATCVGVFAGCVDVPGLDSQLLANLGITPGLLAEDGGNVVVSYTNGAKQAVKWRIAWQPAGTQEQSFLAVTLEPGQTRTLTLDGSVQRIGLGNLGSWSVAAVVDPAGDNPHVVSYGAGPLENGVDYRNGDIVRYQISPTGQNTYLIAAEVAKGG